MAAAELTGRPLSAAIRADVAARAARTAATLAVVSASADASSAWYVRSLARAAEQVGIGCEIDDLGPEADHDEIGAALRRRSEAEHVSGVILQTPLPPGVDHGALVAEIAAAKDVDGANPLSIGRLAARQPAFAPATAAAVIRLLDYHHVELAGANAVVLGRSLVVGLPAGMLLTHRNATVTTCHSRTEDLPRHTRAADVLVVAIGRAHMLTPEYVGADTVVVDVGTNVDADGNLVGDVHPSVAAAARALTPVPGGVGPVTTALLLEHTVTAAECLA
jgi:methylenetetrahydrofolate dehydrogenase (NADP+)/methenyltetrahydrofolate cyclohydrolase